MPREFISITQDDIDARLAENLHSRELELMSYDFERANHEAAIEAFGKIKWDESTAPYKGLSRDAMVVRALAAGLSSDQIQTISNLNALENHKANLEAVKIETSTSERHYDGILAALPKGARREAALANVQAKLEAAKDKG